MFKVFLPVRGKKTLSGELQGNIVTTFTIFRKTLFTLLVNAT